MGMRLGRGEGGRASACECGRSWGRCWSREVQVRMQDLGRGLRVGWLREGAAVDWTGLDWCL